jgi:hypothetical protein
MRSTALVPLLILAASACSTSPGVEVGSPAPAAASTTAAAGANPCAGATCRVVVEVEAGGLANEFNRKQANYKLYQGCPRSLGVSSPSQLRGVAPLVSSRTPAFSIPGTLQGRYATVGLFFGAEPARYVLVDFGANTTGTVDFGYVWTGNAMADDSPKVNANNSFITRSCR